MVKIILAIIVYGLWFTTAYAQNTPQKQTLPNPAKPIQQVDVACGECRLGLPGKDCDLAVRVNGKAYFVDGTAIDDHGDAHAKDGFCNTIRQANVQGEIIGNRFKITYFKLLPEKPNTSKK